MRATSDANRPHGGLLQLICQAADDHDVSDKGVCGIYLIASGLQRTRQFRNGVHTIAAQVVYQPAIDLPAYERIIKQRSANTDCGRTRNHELDRILRSDDAALADDGRIVMLRDFIDLVCF